MSATKDYVNKKWIDWVLGLLVTMIAVFTTIKTEVFGTYATKDYVDGRMIVIEKDVDAVRREQAREMENVFRLLERIDKRAERIEDRINSNR